MNSRILNFFNVKLDAFIVFVSVVVVIMFIALFFLLLDYLKMRKRYVEFMTGESGKSLEYTIYKRFREIDKLKAGQKDNDAQIAIIYDMLRRNYSKVGIYKYDAFNVENSLSGGSISFALTLLNSRDNGFILNVIPIIAMTANAFQEDAEKCIAVGMNAHLAKPLNIEKMMTTICHLVKKKNE